MCKPVVVSGLPEEKRPLVPAEHKRLILEPLRSRGSVSVSAVEEQFGVSPMTARRDLALLADGGYARRAQSGTGRDRPRSSG